MVCVWGFGMESARIRRHHLIEEAKAELDLAYEEVKGAEQTIMSLEDEYNEQIKEIDRANGVPYEEKLAQLMGEKESRQERLAIDSLYDLQTCAVERFAMVCAAFTIVASVEDEGISLELLRKVLFREDEMRQNKVEIDQILRSFARGLRDYSKKASNRENDHKVRNSWANIEGLLRGFGRKI